MGDSVAEDAEVDARLARRVQAGDRAAEGLLCRRIIPRLRIWALRRSRDADLASDVAQEAALAVIEQLRAGTVQSTQNLGAYMRGVAQNVLFASSRTERRRHDLLEKFGASFSDVTTLDESRLDLARVLRCLEGLAPRNQTLLLLTFYAEKSGEEIAHELGMSAGNVRVQRHRALAQMYQCVQEAR